MTSIIITRDVEIDVDLDDFEDEDIVAEAKKILAREGRWLRSLDDTTAGQDYGATSVHFNSFDALRLREALTLGDAYTVMDLVVRSMGDMRRAA